MRGYTEYFVCDEDKATFIEARSAEEALCLAGTVPAYSTVMTADEWFSEVDFKEEARDYLFTNSILVVRQTAYENLKAMNASMELSVKFSKAVVRGLYDLYNV